MHSRQAGEAGAVTAPMPQIVAHRGSSETEAEHTLGAYLAAIDEGADALECDVRLTADGHLVCVHDRDLRRTAATEQLVAHSDLADLEHLDFAGWKRPWADLDDEAEPPDPELGRILPMRTLLETVADQPRRIELAVETKHPSRYGGLVEERLVDLLDDFGWAGPGSPARVMSFSPVALRRVRALAPELDVVLLFDKPSQWWRGTAVAERDWIAGPGISLLRSQPRLARRVVATAPQTHVWTVNTPDDLRLCLELGVDAVITDRPGAIRTSADQEID